MTIHEFGRRLRAREVTAEEVTEGCLRQIETGLEIAAKLDVRKQAFDFVRVVQNSQSLFGRSCRERLLALFLKIGFRKDADLRLVLHDENERHV